MTSAQRHLDLTGKVSLMSENVEKFDKGNKAAGVQLRNALLEIRKDCDAWRGEILGQMKGHVVEKGGNRDASDVGQE